MLGISSNVVQYVVSITTLVKGEIDVVQQSIIGAVIMNIVMIVGLSVFLGGQARSGLYFNRLYIRSLNLELILGTGGLVLPLGFQIFADGSQVSIASRIAQVSHAASIVLLISYGCLVLFSFRTHSKSLLAPEQEGQIATPSRVSNLENGETDPQGKTATKTKLRKALPRLSTRSLIVALVLDVTFLGFNVTFATDIDAVMQEPWVAQHLSRNFIGLVIFPIIGCNPHAITLALRNQLSYSFAISISSSAQLLNLVLPLCVIVGWILGNPNMTLMLDGFQVVTLFVSLLCLLYATGQGSSFW